MESIQAYTGIQALKLNTSNEDRITVSARELYKFLGATERFSSWFERMRQYGLIEGEDFTSVKSFTVVNNGAHKELDDYQLTIDAAKQISMLQRNERGTMARKYFIQVEKDWNSPEKVMARALSIAKKEISNLSASIDEMKPKALFADAVTASETSILVRDFAKILKQNGVDTGEKRLYKWFRDNGFIIKNSTEPTQRAMEMGLFERIERTIQRSDKPPVVTSTTRITGKGQVYFTGKLLADN